MKNLKNVIGKRVQSEDRRSSQSLHDNFKNIGENLKSRYHIELKVKQKGAPFLLFEVSKIGAGYFTIPACDGNDTSVASMVVKEFCLSN